MANPTTNYGFVLPTSSDLVTDLPADFDVALQGVDTRLKALQPGTTTGDLAYSSATANTNTRLGIGSTSQVLTVAGGVPTWATPAAGGGFTQLATGSLSSTVTRIQSIPGTYKELILYVLKPLFTNTNGTLYFRYNNDSATRYSSDTGAQNYGDTFRYDAFYCTSDLSNVAADGLYRMEVPHYANTTTWKIAKVYGANNTKSGSANTVQMGTIDGVYNQTGAITEVDIVSTAGNFTGGSYILYGVN